MLSDVLSRVYSIVQQCIQRFTTVLGDLLWEAGAQPSCLPPDWDSVIARWYSVGHL